MLNKLFGKSEIWFAVLFICIYVFANSILIQLSEASGYEMLYTIPFNIILLIVIFNFIKKNDLASYYGLGRVQSEAKYLLFYVPLILVATVNIWMGICFKMEPIKSVVYFGGMFITGVAEEILFRGLLFRAVSRKNLKRAVILTSILFGAGHIVNLINGNSDNTFNTICQMCYAMAIGFLLAAVLCVGKSIIPGMITHALVNALSTFSNEAAFENIQVQVSIVLCLISGISAIVIFKMPKAKSGNSCI